MKIEKQKKTILPKVVQTNRKGTSYEFINNRPEFIVQAKLISSLQEGHPSGCCCPGCVLQRISKNQVKRDDIQRSNLPLQRKVIYSGTEYSDAQSFMTTLGTGFTTLSERLKKLGSSILTILSKHAHLKAKLELYRNLVESGVDLKNKVAVKDQAKKTTWGASYTSVYDEHNSQMKDPESVISLEAGVLLSRFDQLLFISANPLETFIQKLIQSSDEFNLGNNVDEAIAQLEELIELYELHIKSLEYKTKVNETTEIQVLKMRAFTFVTSNPVGFDAGSQKTDSIASVSVKGEYFINPVVQGERRNMHAEIILLANVIYQIFQKGCFPIKPIYLGGIKPPCGMCLQVIREFLKWNNNTISLKYINASFSEILGMPSTRGAGNVSDGYVNGLSILTDLGINNNTIIKKYPGKQEHENANSALVTHRLAIQKWLLDMLNVIHFDPSPTPLQRSTVQDQIVVPDDPA